jgi:hypothetical protein
MSPAARALIKASTWTKRTLRQRRAGGYRVRVSSRIGHQEVLAITPEQIAAQIDLLDRIKRR